MLILLISMNSWRLPAFQQMRLKNEEGIVQTPRSGDWYADDQLSFAADTRWDEFIVAYYAATSTPIPTYTLPGPRGGIRPTQQKVYLPLVLKTQ